MTPLALPDALRTSASYAGRRVLVTGGASFIGSHLVELLVALGARVRVADDLSSGRRDHLAAVLAEVELLEGDLRRPDVAARAAEGAETVFHLAAMHGGRGYIDTHPVECTSNMLLDHVVLDACLRAGAGRIVHASSACVYPVNLQDSDSRRGLLKETDAGFEHPGGAFADGEYGWAKLMGELQLRAFHKQHGIDAVAARIFTAYGERENESHAVIALLAKAMRRLDPFPVWGDGWQTRNFTHVSDTAVGLALCGGLTGHVTLNVGSSRHHTVRDLLEEIFACCGWRPDELDLQLDRPVGVRSRASDNARILALTGWQPGVGLREGVARTVEWYRDARPDRYAVDLDTLLTSR